MRDQILKQLLEVKEEEYRKFSEKIIPNGKHILGVRMPKLRKVAIQIAGTEAEQYLLELEENIHLGEELYYEEIMLYGLIIGYVKMEDEKRQMWLTRFLPHIDNWAICDSCCMTYKWMKKNPDYWWSFLKKQIETEKEYFIRFSVVCMLDHYMNEKYIKKILDLCGEIHYKNYYVKMAIAWAVSVAYVKDPDRTKRFLEENKLDSDTQKKAIQKICDSHRVNKEEKQKIRQYSKR